LTLAVKLRLVREVIGGAGEGVDRQHVRTHRLGDKARGYRDIFIARAGHPLAVGVGLGAAVASPRLVEDRHPGERRGAAAR
jgi:hypothetical protein